MVFLSPESSCNGHHCRAFRTLSIPLLNVLWYVCGIVAILRAQLRLSKRNGQFMSTAGDGNVGTP